MSSAMEKMDILKKITASVITILCLTAILILIFRDNIADISAAFRGLSWTDILCLLAMGISYQLLDGLACLILVRTVHPAFSYRQSLEVIYLGVFGKTSTFGAGTIPMQAYHLRRSGSDMLPPPIEAGHVTANGGYYSLTNMKVFSETPEITVTIPDDLPTRRGHEFQGWSDSRKGPASLQPGRYTLYAIWAGGASAATRYALDYKAGLFSPRDTVVKSTADEVELTVTSKAPRSRDQRFLGWSTEKNGAAQYHANDQITLYQDNLTLRLYAVWAN